MKPQHLCVCETRSSVMFRNFSVGCFLIPWCVCTCARMLTRKVISIDTRRGDRNHRLQRWMRRWRWRRLWHLFAAVGWSTWMRTAHHITIIRSRTTLPGIHLRTGRRRWLTVRPYPWIRFRLMWPTAGHRWTTDPCSHRTPCLVVVVAMAMAMVAHCRRQDCGRRWVAIPIPTVPLFVQLRILPHHLVNITIRFVLCVCVCVLCCVAFLVHSHNAASLIHPHCRRPLPNRIAIEKLSVPPTHSLPHHQESNLPFRLNAAAPSIELVEGTAERDHISLQRRMSVKRTIPARK
jgi:hypothetical protein